MIWPPKHWLAALGLFIEFVGVVMFFKWAPPQPDFKESVGLALEDATVLADGRKVSDMVEETRRQKRLYKRMAGIALSLVAFGLVLQLIDAWIFD